MKQITCITCPVSCRITIEVENGEYLFSGNKCINGAKFAYSELTAPVRSLATMVRTVFPDMPVLSVRTTKGVPKEKIKKIIRELSKVVITERKGVGDTIISNISGTRCDVIATSDMLFAVNGGQENGKSFSFNN